jgi:hypothetical protein
MVVLPRVRPCEKRQGFFVRATSGDTRMRAILFLQDNILSPASAPRIGGVLSFGGS